MTFPEQFAKHFREMHFGPSLVGSCLKDALKEVNWVQATTQLHGLNTMAMLVFHINYYINAVIKVLKGGPLDAHDKYSYDMPAISSEEDWKHLIDKAFSEAEEFASLVEKMPEEKLKGLMADPKYGNWFQNLLIIQEHSNYHLGQIVLIKKLLFQQG